MKYRVHGFTPNTAGMSDSYRVRSVHGRDGVSTMEVSTSSASLLPYEASSVGVARRRLVGDLDAAGVCEITVCDAGLVLSELVSNALRHGSPLPGQTVRACWRLGPESVEIAVSDGGGPTAPTVAEPGKLESG